MASGTVNVTGLSNEELVDGLIQTTAYGAGLVMDPLLDDDRADSPSMSDLEDSNDRRDAYQSELLRRLAERRK